VSGGLNRLLATVVLAGAAGAALLAVAPTALACNGGTSAVNVYKECLPTGGNSKSAGGHKTSGGSQSGGQTTSPATDSGVSKATTRGQENAGPDRRVLSSLVRGYGAKQLVGSDQPTSDTAAPTALGSALDLGSGPTALLIVLAGTAVLLIGGSGMRAWRARNRVS
jgi:hypothetical protein